MHGTCSSDFSKNDMILVRNIFKEKTRIQDVLHALVSFKMVGALPRFKLNGDGQKRNPLIIQ